MHLQLDAGRCVFGVRDMSSVDWLDGTLCVWSELLADFHNVYASNSQDPNVSAPI